MSFSHVDTTAATALDTLRGIQGIGSAAIIPASVRIFLVVCSHTLTLADSDSHQLGILAKAFPPGPSRSIAFSTFSAGAPIGAIFSTVLGSVLTQETKYVRTRHHTPV